MDSSILEARHKQFLVIYRYTQIIDKGRYLTRGRSEESLTELVARYKAKPQNKELIEREGEQAAEFLIWWACLIVYLYQWYGPGEGERAWQYFSKRVLKLDSGEAEQDE